MQDNTIIINATPVGTFSTCWCFALIFHINFLSSDHLVFDVVYNPAKTLFLEKTEERGATILNGEKCLNYRQKQPEHLERLVYWGLEDIIIKQTSAGIFKNINDMLEAWSPP